MQVNIPYDRKTISVHVDERRIEGIVEASAKKTEGTIKQVLQYALTHPFGERFKEFLSRPGPLVVIVNDASRPTPTRYILPLLADKLKGQQCEFIIATGAHRSPTSLELSNILSEPILKAADAVHIHNAHAQENLVYLGTTQRGTRVELNRRVAQAGKVLVIGSVEPHYFAGYTGGRKGFFPGVASYEFIEQNHKLALSPDARTLKLEGNPVHEDMEQALQLLDIPIFSLMAVLDRNHELYSISAGDVRQAFYEAASHAKEVYSVPVSQKADVVVTAAEHPMDNDFYQAHKAIEHGKLALKDGGVLILVAACSDGIGEKAFAKLLFSAETPHEVMQRMEGPYRLGYHKAGKIAELSQRVKLQAYTKLDADTLEKMFIQGVGDLQQAVDTALGEDDQRKVLFLLDGTVTVPFLEG